MKKTITGKKYIAVLVYSGSIGLLIGQFFSRCKDIAPMNIRIFGGNYFSVLLSVLFL